jgi:hypothetical protein
MIIRDRSNMTLRNPHKPVLPVEAQAGQPQVETLQKRLLELTEVALSQTNAALREHLKSYKLPDFSSQEPRDMEFSGKLASMLSSVPHDSYVVFKVKFSEETNTGMADELRSRLMRAGAMKEGQNTTELVYHSPRRAELLNEPGNTSASRNALLSGRERIVFKTDVFPDAHLDSAKFKNAFAGQHCIAVNPTGLFEATFQYEPHNIPPFLIESITVTADRKPLTKVYDKNEKKPVRTEDFWRTRT